MEDVDSWADLAAERSDGGLFRGRGLFRAGSSAEALSVDLPTPLTIPPTDVLNLLYSPLRPPCNSPDTLLSSVADLGAGGFVKSLKTVRESDWYAAV